MASARRLQALFLRFLETGAATPTGSSRSERRTNVRIITAASRSLAHAIAAGDFRDDLYYRLNVIRLTIPPLRERGDDIAALLRHHLRSARRRTASGRRDSPAASPAFSRPMAGRERARAHPRRGTAGHPPYGARRAG